MKQSDNGVTFKRLLANEEGVGQLRELNKVFADAFNEKHTYLNKPPSNPYVLSLLGKKHIVVCVALAGTQVVAGLVAYVLEKFEQERSEVYIYDLAVDAQYRRRKIATDLIGFLKREMAGTGTWVIYVQADKGDLPAVKLYESLGTREEVLHFDIEISSKTASPTSNPTRDAD